MSGRGSFYKLFIIWFLLLIKAAPAQPAASVIDTSLGNPFAQIIETLDFKNTDLKDIIRILATKYRINVLVEDGVQQRLTLHLVNVRLEDAIRFIVEDNGLVLKRFGNIYKIQNPPELPSPPKVWHVEYDAGLLSVDLQQEDLPEAIRQISKVSGQTLLVDRQARGTISGRLHKVAFEEGLGELLKINGFILSKVKSTYHIRRMGISGEKNSPEHNFWINVRQGKIDLDVAGAPLRQVLEELSRQSSTNLLLLGSPQGTVNARLNDVTLEECLSLLLLESDFTFKRSGDIYLVGDKNNKGLATSRLIKLKHLKVDGILEMLPGKVTQKAELKIVKEHNALLINGAQDVINDIAAIIRDVDHPIPQVFLEALVVDFNTFDTRELSVEMGVGAPPDSNIIDRYIPGLDLYRSGKDANKFLADISINDRLHRLGGFFSGINIGRLPDDFYLRVKALETAGKANIRSKPQIATLNGHTAELKIGETRYFKLVSEIPLRDPSQIYLQTTERFQTVEINISLKITPWVSASGEITVEIDPEFNTPGDQLSPEVPPNVQSRTLHSTVRLRDGETIVLGGLIQEIDSESVSRLPILGRLPLIGKLFSSRNHNKTKSELIIYVTPHLTYSDEWMNNTSQ
ncbi:MAG: type II and III secretion system protein [Calditrichaeota bacterium]|nr:type II and III secretion system protein [Calditrichota bacterium]MCB0289144.1 type II and III secretion system protein [Calditrichota bacterium]MCB0296140.1 type II and III secretion system protein [Calditrichota bacterium]MCB0302190.1 type II and III secretion system protein [Calditrichota bacterium]MCB0311950.1 type II and III secretion system protein [Calditrichota bacterium]